MVADEEKTRKPLSEVSGAGDAFTVSGDDPEPTLAAVIG
jgi:hypothetical protein